jgi:CPA2 family monovalent cation:H+ antiporter-2
MEGVSTSLLANFLIFLFLPLVIGYLATKLRLPALIGFIVGGVILGNLFTGEIINTQLLPGIATFGIILLLFSVGLEVNLDNFARFGRFVLIGGTAQIIISAVVIFFLSLVTKFSLVESLFIGFSFALSSTAVIAKLLQEKGEESSLLGGLVIGILVLQDLAVIPLIVIFSALSRDVASSSIFSTLTIALVKSGLLLFTVLIVGRKIIPLIYDKLARISRELLNLFTIFLIFAFVYVFALFGLSASIAAFIAGMLISQTLEHYHVFSQIRPMRDLFAIFFFVYLGTSVKFAAVIDLVPKILLFTTLLILIKFAVIVIIFLILRFHSRTSFSIGLYLANIGEFSFIIMHLGFANGLVSQETYITSITTVLLTISAVPIMITNKEKIYKIVRKLVERIFPSLANYIKHNVDREPAHIEALKVRDHVVICGFGRIGKYIGKALKFTKVPFIGIDRNYYAVQKARAQGLSVIYGDPTDIDILDYAQVETAKFLVCVTPSKRSQETIIVNARKLNPKIKILTRVHDEGILTKLHSLGAHLVIQPEFEASLTIIKQILYNLGFSLDQISNEFRKLKKEHEKAIYNKQITPGASLPPIRNRT